jgi:hypothetical protein
MLRNSLTGQRGEFKVARVPDSTARDTRLRALAGDLDRIEDDKQYYQLTLTASADGRLAWGAYSHFVDWTDDTRRFELRAASLVNPRRLFDLYREIGEPCVVANDERALNVFLLVGGHALVEQRVAETHLADVLAPGAVAYSGPLGFKNLAAIPATELQRAPTPRQRMGVLKRDKFRCRICGESPAENPHVVLHVHHVRMWSRGGLTEDHNLITICHTCHGGLDPHEDWSLFNLIPGASVPDHIGRERQEFRDGLERYRIMMNDLSRVEAVRDQSTSRLRSGSASWLIDTTT